MLLLFLVLQIISLSMLVKYNRSHQARYMELSYELTGRINKQYSGVTGYLTLGRNNRLLADENTQLRNLLPANFTSIDTSARLVADTVKYDTLGKIRKYLWRTARVVNNSVNSQNNMITLERGRNQGVQPEMAVMAPSGIVGIVTDVSDNMSVVMSLLHRKSATSVMLKNSATLGIVDWNGVNPGLLQLKGIPKSTAVKLGDTVLTSNISLNYPPGLMVGTVAKIETEKGGNNYLLQLKPGANFYSLQYVDIIENRLLKEQRELETKGKSRQ